MSLLPKIFFLNLPQHENRLLNITSQFNVLGVHAHRIEAIHGASLSQSQVDEIFDNSLALKKRGLVLSRGEIGCALSHRNVWEKIIDQDLAYAVILEDDVLIHKDFLDISNIVSEAPRDWDIIFLGYYIPNKVSDICKVKLKTSYKTSYDYFFPLERVCGTWGYVVSNNAAKQLLADSAPLFKPIDHYTGDFSKLKIFTINCHLTTPDPNIDSSIEVERSELIKFKKNKVYFLSALSFVNRMRKCLLRKIRLYIRNTFHLNDI